MSEDGWWTIGAMLADFILGFIVGYFGAMLADFIIGLIKEKGNE